MHTPTAKKRTSNQADISPIANRIIEYTMAELFNTIINALTQKSEQHNDPQLRQFADQMKSLSTLFDSVNANITKRFNELDATINQKLNKEEYMRIIKEEIGEKERSRSFVASGVPESSFPSSTQRARQDTDRICELLDYMNVEATH
uniref:Uncharacterized protein n=1 Tax=Panagrolaimus davidi TaxID=227884 RepID=A0A914PWK8_9BILA